MEPMAGRDKGDGEGFDWLYGTSDTGVGSGTPRSDQRGGRDDGAEATRVFERPPAGSPPPPPSARPAPSRIAPPPSAPPPGAPPAGGKPPRGRRFRMRPGKVLLLVVIAWLAFLLAVPVFAWNTVSRVDADPGGERPAEQPGTTYLLVGSDSRKGLTPKQRRELTTGGDVGQRTDTIMLLHTGDGPNLLMSIPRDSNVEVPGYGVTKINAAFAFGGPKLLVQTIEQNTGIRVDNYVEIGMGGFVGMVDAVGGIEICPRTAMKDPLAGLDIKKGCQEADGVTALGFARSRKTQQLGDIDRARNQREVVSAVGSEVVSPLTFLNPWRYWSVAFAGAESVRVGDGVSVIGIANFANAMRSVDGDSGLTCGVPIRDLAVTWDAERAERLFTLIREDRTSEVGRSLCQPSGLPR